MAGYLPYKHTVLLVALVLLLLPACSSFPLFVPSATAAPPPPEPVHIAAPIPTLDRSSPEEEAAASLSAGPERSSPTPFPTLIQVPEESSLPTIPPISTLVPLPTFSPAAPLESSQEYQLAPWEAERANEMILLAQALRDALVMTEEGAYSLEYYSAWKPVSLAIQEAVLRYPDGDAAEDWLWLSAYALTQVGAGQEAVKAYAELVAGNLNSGKVIPEDLPVWFRLRQRPFYSTALQSVLTHLDLLSSPIRFPRSQRSFLINLQDGEQGGLCFLLLEKDGDYQSYPIYSSLMSWDDPRGERKNFTGCTAVDVDGDGWDEVLASTYEGGSYGETHLQIFTLSQLPPKPLPFGPDGKDTFQVGWGGYQGFEYQDGRHYLRYMILPSPGCSLSVNARSRWNGEWFESARVGFDFKTAGDELSECFDFIADFASLSNPAVAGDLLDGAIRHWFRRTTALEMPDQFDELRVLKGLNLAFDGQVDAARGVFAALAASPTIPGSTWVVPAQNFLQIYRAPQDIYQACQALKGCLQRPGGEEEGTRSCVEVNPCDLRKSLAALVQTIPSTSIPVAVDWLKQWGVPIQSSGRIDLDGDGRQETWFTVRHPGAQDPELWVLVSWEHSLKALMFEDAPLPLLKMHRFGSQDGGLVLINGEKQYQFKRLDSTGEPFLLPIQALPDPVQTQAIYSLFEDLRGALYSGSDPLFVLISLMEIENWQQFPCPETGDLKSSTFCEEYRYTIGLAAELSGHENAAVQAYHRLWTEYPESPYAYMARLKLADADSSGE
jgi:hypothetical protein